MLTEQPLLCSTAGGIATVYVRHIGKNSLTLGAALAQMVRIYPVIGGLLIRIPTLSVSIVVSLGNRLQPSMLGVAPVSSSLGLCQCDPGQL